MPSAIANSMPLWVDVPVEIKDMISNIHSFKDLEYRTDSQYMTIFRYDQSRNLNGQRHVRSVVVSRTSLKMRSDLTDDQKKCFYTFMSGGQCGEKNIKASNEDYYNGELDLLSYVRRVSTTNGLYQAKNILIEKLSTMPGQDLKKKLIDTTLNKDKKYPNTFSEIPQEERSRIGVYLILGIGGDDSDNSKLIRNASDEIAQMGFYSEMLEVDPNLGSVHNAKILKDIFEQKIENMDKVIIVAASKGVADFITYFLNYGDSIKKENRDKIRLMVSLSGVVRGSYVAKYMTESKSPMARSVRTLLRLKGDSAQLKGIASLAVDPWVGHDRTKIISLFPNLKWLSLPSIPEADTALTNLSLWSGFLRKPVHRWMFRTNLAISPGDGLVETAAAILPPGTGIEETVIPVYGPHAIAIGSYEPGIRIAPETQQQIYDEVNPAAGPEILDAMFRALPQSLIQ